MVLLFILIFFFFSVCVTSWVLCYTEIWLGKIRKSRSVNWNSGQTYQIFSILLSHTHTHEHTLQPLAVHVPRVSAKCLVRGIAQITNQTQENTTTTTTKTSKKNTTKMNRCILYVHCTCDAMKYCFASRQWKCIVCTMTESAASLLMHNYATLCSLEKHSKDKRCDAAKFAKCFLIVNFLNVPFKFCCARVRVFVHFIYYFSFSFTQIRQCYVVWDWIVIKYTWKLALWPFAMCPMVAVFVLHCAIPDNFRIETSA